MTENPTFESPEQKERHNHWTTTFQLHNQEPNRWGQILEKAPENISFEISLQGDDPLNSESWNLIVDHDPEADPNKLYSLQVTQEGVNYRLKFSAGQGDETGGVMYEGEIVVDPTSGKLVSGELHYDHSHPDGGSDGDYKIANNGS